MRAILRVVPPLFLAVVIHFLRRKCFVPYDRCREARCLIPLIFTARMACSRSDLTLQNQKQNDGFMHYCYIYMYQGQIIEAPTLRSTLAISSC